MTATIPMLATDRQFTFVRSLTGERDLSGLNAAYRARIDEILAGTGAPLTAVGASTLIEGLLTLPRLEQTDEFDVPAGHYAIEVGEDMRFFRVDRPEEGRWAGFTFVKMLAGGDEIRLDRRQSATVLERIASEPRAAAIRYGHEIGSCSVCNRRLTNQTSRDAGIGPVCAAKRGW